MSVYKKTERENNDQVRLGQVFFYPKTNADTATGVILGSGKLQDAGISMHLSLLVRLTKTGNKTLRQFVNLKLN